nr:somatic embryogenesis receptor kinase 1-like [Arachis hypogaea]
MDALETIDLHNNTIEGPIPDFLGLLPKLKTLNLSHNRFNGSIPPSLKNTKIEIDTTNNCLSGMKCPLLFDTQPPPPPPQLFLGDETNSPPPPLLLSGDEPSGNGSMKRDLSLIVVMQILLPVLFIKFF